MGSDMPPAGVLSASLQDRLDALFSSYDRTGSPGCSVALARHGRTIYRAGFGMASLESGRVNAPTTRMPIGSVTKQFTCAALLMLADDGRLSLDDALGDWLSELQGDQRRPTLRQVMTQTGGIRCYLDHAVFNGYATMSAGTPMALQVRQQQLNFEPGTGVSYSNGGYRLLAAVVERVSGVSFERFLCERIFEPVGMWSTEVARHGDSARPATATSYVSVGRHPDRWRPAKPLADELLGDGGITSTVDDMLRWATYLQTSAGPVNLQTLAVTANLTNGSTSSYGFGVISEPWRGLHLVNHIGGLPGSNSILAMLPEQDLDVILLFNRNVPVREIAQQVLESALVGEVGAAPPLPRSADYASLIGSYFDAEYGFLFGFADANGALALSVFGGAAAPLEGGPNEVDVLPFSAEVGISEIRFRDRPAEKGPASSIEYLEGGCWRAATRIAPGTESNFAFFARSEGNFHSGEFGASLSFAFRAGQLRVVLEGEFGSSDCPAQLLADDLIRFESPQFGGGYLARVLRDSGDVVAVVVTTPRTRRTVFARRPK